jgi:hypothetical protein
MQTHHPDKIREFHEKKKIRIQTPLVNEFSEHAQPTSAAVTQARTNWLISKWLNESQRAHDLTNDPGFREVINYVSGGAVVAPSRTIVSEETKMHAAQLRLSLKMRIAKECIYYTLTTDHWTDRATRSYSGVTLHYLDEDFVMNGWLLEVEPLPGKHTGKLIAKAIRIALTRWGLRLESCVRLVRDGAANVVVAADDLGVSSFSCVAHSLHLVVGAALIKKMGIRNVVVPLNSTQPRHSADALSMTVAADDATTTTDGADPTRRDDSTDVADNTMSDSELDNEDVDPNTESTLEALRQQAAEEIESNLATTSLGPNHVKALSWIRDQVHVFRALATYFRKSAKVTGKLIEIRDQVQKGTTMMFGLDCPTRWSSTYEMLMHFIKLRLTLDTFFAYLVTEEGKTMFDRTKITQPTPEQWLIAKCLLCLIEPFAVAVEELSGSRYPTLSLAFPALRHIKTELMDANIFDPVVKDHPDMQQATMASLHHVRFAMLKLFRARFTGLDPAMIWVPLLDPRLTDLEHLGSSEREQARLLFLQEVVRLEREVELDRHTLTDISPSTTFIRCTPEKKKKYRVAVFGRRANRAATVAGALAPTVKQRCESAIDAYIRDAATADVCEDPLEWWSKHLKRIPSLHGLRGSGWLA